MYYDWVDGNICSPLPTNAVWCSKDKDGSDIYIGRCQIENSLLAVKIVGQRREAYTGYKGKEIPVANFKILINHGKDYHIWKRGLNGSIPQDAVECGFDHNNFRIYVGKAYHNGSCVPGYVNPNNRCIHISFGGKEHKYSEYEVLCHHEQQTNLHKR